MTIIELFIKLAQPDEKGESRWVSVEEFVNEYAPLKIGNGLSWGRSDGKLARDYIIDKKRVGNKITHIRLAGFNKEAHFEQHIRSDIKAAIRKQKCVMLGVRGTSINTKIEVDHKDGRKRDMRVSDMATQKMEDFQPLCKAANDVKRQICKECELKNIRWNAKNIKGNPYPFYEGDEHYTEELGCKGCYQYDPVEYRKVSAQRIAKEASEHTTEFIMNKLYGENNE